MKVAAIDIGTNTFLCLIAEVREGVVESIVSDEVEIVRIGENVAKTGKFSEAALVRAETCLQRFSSQIKKSGAEKVKAVATSAARDVVNGNALIEMGIRYGIPIEIIEGRREADLTYFGVRSNPVFGVNSIVIDVGGGSTEVIFEEKQNNSIVGESFDLGAVRLTEMFVTEHPIPESEIKRLRSYARKGFEKIQTHSIYQAVAVAGTPTTLAALEQKIEYTRDSIEGYVLTLPVIEKWARNLASMTIEQRAALPGLEPKRADIVVAGTLILAEALIALGLSELRVSTRGVRFGLAIEMGAKT